MPGKIKVKVLAGRNLPVMDRASDTTDAFVEIKFGSVTHKTDVCRKSLHPHWNNTEWYRFEVDESELQDEPLQLRLMDHDTYSANDAIGKVVISLAPLLAREANNVKNTAAPHGGAVMSGWIPVFDTMHGIRGELNVIVKVELFSDFNKYKTSSCGVQFFHCPMIPPGYRATAIHGFVEELVVNDDPEYQWIDKIRTPRASNEARQVAFIKLSNQVQRLVGLKAAELGANAVVGYQQDFDLEGEAGVVARAIGTAISIAPLPTPSQTTNIPPCTQQQLKKYLDILANDNETTTDLNQYYQTHQEELQKMITILNPNASSLLDEGDLVDEDEKSMDLTRQSSITSSYVGCISLYQDEYVSQKSLRHLSEDQIDLNRLLNREGDDSDSSGPLQKIKKIKTNFFTKRFSKSKKKSQKQEDQISLQSNSSETSRMSLYDIKNELKKLKLKKPKFRKPFVNNEDEGEGMASILARSVIHARTSLACIAEKDSEHSPTSTIRQTSESEPTINISDEERNRKNLDDKSNIDKIPDIRYTSLSNINVKNSDQRRQRKISESCPATPVAERSENLLKLPGEVDYYGSVSSALSGESSDMYSSSEEDDESSDVKTDTERSIETTSSVVHSVLSHEVNPTLIAQMDKKLSILESVAPDLNEIKRQELKKAEGFHNQERNMEVKTENSNNKLQIVIDKSPIEKCKSLESVPREIESNKKFEDKPFKSNEASTSLIKEDTSVSKSSSHHMKFHNPFAHKKPSTSISAPSSPLEKNSFVYRSSQRIQRQLSKLSKSSMIKSLSHYSLLPKKKETKTTLSHPGSSTDFQSKFPSETVLGSTFMSYSDLLCYSLLPKKKETKTPLSHPGSSTDIQSKNTSETVLGSTFMSYSDLLSLDLEANKIEHKGENLGRGKVSMYIGSEPVSRASLSGLSSIYFTKEDQHDHKRPSLKSSGLVHTAMETILLDKVQNLLMPTSPDCHSAQTKQFFNDVNEKLEKVGESRTRYISELHSDLQSISGSLSPTISSFSSNSKLVSDKNSKNKDKHPNLVQTAIETILMDKVQSILIPTTLDSPTPQIIYDESKNTLEDHCRTKNTNKKPGIIQTLLGPKTPDSKSPSPSEKFSFSFSKFDKNSKSQKTEVKTSGLVHTAMETILMEKVQSVLGPKTPEPSVSKVLFDERPSEELVKDHENDSDVVETAVKTILMNNVQQPLLGSQAIEPVMSQSQENFSMTRNSEENIDESRDSTDTAVETNLLDEVKSLVEQPNASLVELEDGIDHKTVMIEKRDDELKSPGLIQLAVQTILLEKAQSLVPADTDNQLGVAEHIKPPSHCVESSVQLVQENMQPDKEKNYEEPEPSRSVLNAVQTILLDKVQSLLPADSIITVSNTFSDQKYDDNGDLNKNISEKESGSEGLVQTALQTILLDKLQSLVPDKAIIIDEIQTSVSQSKTSINDESSQEKEKIEESDDHSGLIQTATQSILLDKVKPSIPDTTIVIAPENSNINNEINVETEDKPSGLIIIDKVQSSLFPALENIEIKNEPERVIQINKDTDTKSRNSKKLQRQDSVRSVNESETPKKSNTRKTAPCITKPPVLQHFHPILSGAPLETIPSLPEGSIEHSESIDSDTNKASVCGNLHAAWDADRGEREKESKIDKDRGSPRHARHESYGGKEPPAAHAQNSSLNASSTPLGIHRRSSDSDLSVTPKGGSLNTLAGNVGSGGGAILRPSMNSNNLDMLEYPFLTMTEYPPGFIMHIGGTVCARSVKLVDGGGESAARAACWAELRTELRAHARALRCNAVIAYCDTAAICEDVCVLSASGTAAVINLDCDFNAELETNGNTGSKYAIDELEPEACSVAHVPYSPGAGPYRAELATCGGCRRARVPTVLLATCAKPNRLTSHTKAITLTAVAARVRRAPPTSEPGARDISDQLPFLEYELHKLLLAKLRMQGANALFSLQTQIAVGERCVMALASGTAVRLAALPPPTPPTIKASENDKDALDIQKALWDSFKANTAANGFDIGNSEHHTNGVLPELEGDEAPVLDLCADKDACVLELDEAEDVETARSLATRHAHMQVFTPTLKPSLGAAPLAFAQVWRGRLSLGGQGGQGGPGGPGGAGERHVRRALGGVAYKLRRLQPCALVAPRFQLELPDDEIQLVVSGAAIPLRDPSKPHLNGLSESHANPTGDADDDIFALDEEQLVKSQPVEVVDEKNGLNGQVHTMVSLTSLSNISGGRVVRRLCALRLLFVRETTAVRELGGLSGFLHTFTCEVLAIARAYTAALGGNALTSFYLTQLMLQDNAHKNQGQCLLSVGGDVVHITY